MPDREKVMTGLELCTAITQDGCLGLCPYKDERVETYSGFCEQVLIRDALSLLKEQAELLKEQDEIVRCKECYFKLRQEANGAVVCNLDGSQHEGDWYCPKGERSLTKDA